MEDQDVDPLSCPPSTKASRYQRMKAYNNHFRVSDCVATLALGSRLRQGLAKVRVKSEARESQFMLPGVWESVRE
jgi:hypothetical protein